MATTIVPKYDMPVTVSVDEIRDELQEELEYTRGDEDKADDIENSIYYAGAADALEGFLNWITTPTMPNEGNHMAEKQTMDTIEKTIDMTTDTLDTLERIPKVNLNGTTKKQQVIILLTVSAVSAAAGIAITIAAHRGKLHLRRRKNKKVIRDFRTRAAE